MNASGDKLFRSRYEDYPWGTRFYDDGTPIGLSVEQRKAALALVEKEGYTMQDAALCCVTSCAICVGTATTPTGGGEKAKLGTTSGSGNAGTKPKLTIPSFDSNAVHSDYINRLRPAYYYRHGSDRPTTQQPSTPSTFESGPVLQKFGQEFVQNRTTLVVMSASDRRSSQHERIFPHYARMVSLLDRIIFIWGNTTLPEYPRMMLVKSVPLASSESSTVPIFVWSPAKDSMNNRFAEEVFMCASNILSVEDNGTR